jgi:hypothetical protein
MNVRSVHLIKTKGISTHLKKPLKKRECCPIATQNGNLVKDLLRVTYVHPIQSPSITQNPLSDMKKKYALYLTLVSVLIFSACGKDQQGATKDATVTTTTPPVDVQNKDLVLTPGGWRPASKVGRVAAGEHLEVSGERLNKVSDATGKVIQDFGAIERKAGTQPDYPNNVFIPEARKVLTLASGWIAYTYWSNPSSTPITSFTSTFTVPPVPSTSHGQTIFLFPGLQNSSYILQPVLQWGPSAAGGGNYWAIANWYVDGSSGTALFSSLVRVNPGTVLTGVMTQTGTTGSNYNYVSSFTGYSSINLAVNNIQKLYWAAESLEVYGVTVCSDYPNTTKTRFSGITLLVGGAASSLSWSVANAVTDCGQHGTVVTNGSPNGIVDLYY